MTTLLKEMLPRMAELARFDSALENNKEFELMADMFSLAWQAERGDALNLNSDPEELLNKLMSLLDLEKEIEHVGLRSDRQKDNLEEAIFAEAWAKFAKDRLAYLFSSNREPIEITQREATLAATIGQWLGSPVGLGFLETTLAKAGYEMRPIKKEKTV